jgi:hypothetical protein
MLCRSAWIQCAAPTPQQSCFARDDEDMQLGPCHLDAFGQRQGTALQVLPAVGCLALRQRAVAAAVGNEDGVLGRQFFIAAQALQGCLEGVLGLDFCRLLRGA